MVAGLRGEGSEQQVTRKHVRSTAKVGDGSSHLDFRLAARSDMR